MLCTCMQKSHKPTACAPEGSIAACTDRGRAALLCTLRCAQDDIFHAVKAIVATQRDYGRRDNRKQARLKYLVQEWGIDRFRSVVEQYMGKKFDAFVPMPKWEYKDYMGWDEQGDGKLFYGLYIQVSM